MKIAFVHISLPKLAEWRGLKWARAIDGMAFHHAFQINMDDFVLGTAEARACCEKADALVLQGNLFGPVISQVQHWKAHGKTILVDIDDHFDVLFEQMCSQTSHGNKASRFTISSDKQFEWGLRLMDGALVSHASFAAKWAGLAQFYVIPPALDFDLYLAQPPIAHDGIVIGWCDAYLDQETTGWFENIIQRVACMGADVRFLRWGADRRAVWLTSRDGELVVDKIISSQWPGPLGYVDIGLLPISTGARAFGCQEDVLELMAMKIPWVVSETESCSELKEFGWFIENTPAAWERILVDMVEHAGEYRSEAARLPYLYAMSQSFSATIFKALDRIEALCQSAATHMMYNRTHSQDWRVT